jgi:hypothetical protein
MSTLSQFVGGAPTTSIVNAVSGGGVTTTVAIQASTSSNTKAVLSGALTANTLATALSVTGGGEVPFLSAYAIDATARTIRCVVTVDGVSVFDATSASISTTNHGLLVMGWVGASSALGNSGAPLRFNASLLVQIASDLTETDKVAIAYTLNKR